MNGPGLRLESGIDGVHVVAVKWQAIGGPAPSEGSGGTGNSPHLGKKSTRGRVLIVDDEPLIRWSIGETLGDCGYEVSEAGDAVSAIRTLSAGPGADLVLLDLRLPDADDLRVLSALRRLAPRMPVILMTAYGSPELFMEARRLGAFAIVDKPFEIDAIPPLVARALAARPH